MLKSLVSGILIAQTAFVFAQSDSAKIKQLNPVVITATKSEKNLIDVGRSISVITSDDIEKSVCTNLSDLLSSKEGIFVIGNDQNPGMAQSIFTRGANSNQTVIMIDGVRITDPSSTNNAFDLSELSLSNIERVEIVRGSHSTIYGSSAIGGVINIITKKTPKKGLNINADLTGGTFGKNTSLFTENIFANYTFENGFYLNGSALNTSVKGFDATLDTVTMPNVFKNRDNDDFSKLEYNAKLGFKKEKADIYVAFRGLDHDIDLDKSAYTDDDNYTLDFNRSLISYGGFYKLSQKLKIGIIGGYSQMKRFAVDDSSVVDAVGNYDHTYYTDTYQGTTLSNDIQLNYKQNNFEIVAGGGLYNETMTSKNYYYTNGIWGPYEIKNDLDTLNISATTANVFVHGDFSGALIGKKFSRFMLSAGARYNNHELFGYSNTFEINPSVKLDKNAILYFSFSTGFNAPSLYQMYCPTTYTTWDTYYSTGLTRGNKKLNPETSKSFEIGYKQTINNISLSASYFNTIVDNVIEFVYLWDKNIGTDTLGQNWGRDDYRGETYLNAGTQFSQGIELNFISEINDKFTVDANLSIVNGKLEYDPAILDFAQTDSNHVQLYSNGEFLGNKKVSILGLTRRPNTGNINITYAMNKKATLVFSGRYIGSYNDVYYNSELGPYGALGTVGVEDYALMDVSFRYLITKNLKGLLKIENVFDKKYTEINGFRTKSRGIYLSLKYKI